jgi:hypothetical protein
VRVRFGDGSCRLLGNPAPKQLGITEDTVRDVALPKCLVDVEVCAIDDTWSGLKLMWRKELC